MADPTADPFADPFADLYIGLMSGTSMDGVDGVLADFSGIDRGFVKVLAHAHQIFPPDLATEFLALNTSGSDELHRATLASNELARVCASVMRCLLESSGVSADQVRAVGAHGQTVRHRPGEFDAVGYTVQLNNAALLAELAGIDVVADFRSRDVAAGGQGAPLVPAFHRAVFGKSGQASAVLNIGGISNLTLLQADGSTIGFDCGPGNVLMDHWCQVHTGNAFDDAGRWAESGVILEPLLAALLNEPYFNTAPPKSTGRDRFHPAWLAQRLDASDARAQDVQATLVELTATVCADALLRNDAAARELLVCGGGAFNRHLMRRLAARLPSVQVMQTDERGLPASQVEACAFAWLARAFVRREPGNLSAVTGANGPRVLGALYPAH